MHKTIMSERPGRVLHQIFGREVQHAIKKMDPIGSKVL